MALTEVMHLLLCIQNLELPMYVANKSQTLLSSNIDKFVTIGDLKKSIVANNVSAKNAYSRCKSQSSKNAQCV